MVPILVDHRPSQDLLTRLHLLEEPIRQFVVGAHEQCSPSRMVAYVAGGVATLTSEDGAPIVIEAGMLLSIPAGCACLWEVSAPLTLHCRER